MKPLIACLIAACALCRAAAAGEVALEIYDVRAMTTTLLDFPGPFNGVPASAPGQAANPFDAPPATLGAPDLAQLIQERLLAAEFADPATSIQEAAGKLVVLHTPEVQKKVLSILGVMSRRFNARVSVQALEIRLPVEQALALQAKEDQPLTNEQLEALLKGPAAGKLLAAPQVVLFNGQRGYVSGGRLATFVSGEKAGDQGVERKLDKLLSGTVLEVRPVINELAGQVQLDLRYGAGMPGAPEARQAPQPAPVQGDALHTTLLLKPGAWFLAGTLRAMPHGGALEPGPSVNLLLIRCDPVRSAGPTELPLLRPNPDPRHRGNRNANEPEDRDEQKTQQVKEEF
ncbi:MAG: hypothetical protein M5U26_08100 [Planctomycetota bacterium]|nr:hypothetical protein [Planctomycetota bacterium]